MGIRGMRERVRHFRGDLVIKSNGSGTKVHATLPIEDTTFNAHEQPAAGYSMKPDAMTSRDMPYR